MVEGGRLESDYTLTGIGGSNPLSSVFAKAKTAFCWRKTFCASKRQEKDEKGAVPPSRARKSSRHPSSKAR